jgi:arylsulfatase A-like enzyme
LLPTFCDLAEIPLPEDIDFDGASFAPVLVDKPMVRKKPLYWQYNRAISKPYTMSLLTVDDWKLLSDERFEKLELYHLSEDLGETNNVANQNPEIVNLLLQQLKKRRSECNSK